MSLSEGVLVAALLFILLIVYFVLFGVSECGLVLRNYGHTIQGVLQPVQVLEEAIHHQAVSLRRRLKMPGMSVLNAVLKPEKA